MAAKLTLSKIKGKPSSSVPLMSFRFLPNEDDLEEVTPEEQENDKEKETVIPFKSSNTYPISLNEKINTSTEISNIPHSLSTESNDIFKDKFSTSSNSENELSDRFNDVCTEKSDVKYSSSFPSEPIKLHSESMHNVGTKETRDSSPMKESVKEYLAKFGKKSSSLENSPATETDSWSLFNELKGRITKTFEEKITRESNYSSKSLDKLSSQKSTELVFPGEITFNEKDIDSSEKYISSPSYVESEDKTVSTECMDIDRKSVSSEDQLPLSIETDSRSFSNLNENTDDNTDMSKCVILTSNTNQKKTVSTIAASAQALLSPKRTRPSMSVTLSSLMAAKVLDSDSIEENKSDLDSPEVINPKESDTTEGIVVSQESEQTETIDSPSESPDRDNFLLKICYKYTISKELYVACTNLFASWQNQTFGLLFIFIACLIAPIPPFLSGLITGIIISIVIGSILWWLFQPINSKESLFIPDYENLPKLTIPSLPSEKDTDIYKGWMNELPFEYNPDTYHVNCTRSVYVRLDGTSLRLSHPKNNIPKRAMWNEVRHDPVFIRQRHLNIAGATISLLPEGLARKRLWSKKYPICLDIPSSPSQVTYSESSGSKEVSPRDSMSSFSSVESFDDVTDESLKKYTNVPGSKVLYLFARTSREKEEWYWLLYAATKQKSNWLKSSVSGTSQINTTPFLTREKRTFSIDSGTSASTCITNELSDKEILKEDSLEFNNYMSQFLDKERWFSTFTSFASIAYSKERRLTSPDTKNVKSDIKESMLWLNALIGRIFFNFLTEKDWSDAVVDRIQKKLDKIRVPYFIQELKLTDINLGKAIPQIQRASDPVMDDKGVWVDLDITYNGSFEMTLETKLNLLRLKKNQSVEMDEVGLMADRCLNEKSSRSYMLNSEEEDSAESSSDDELYSSEMSEHGNLISSPSSQLIATSGSSTSKKLLRWVDKLAQSRCFQQATENKFVKRAMEEVSNTPLFLTVEIHGLIGTLAINIPPLPTDRLWYGFRNNPQLSISARPKFGERKVTLSPVTDWIKKKLVLEFQKILVMPNMDDLIIPIMNANLPSSKS